MDPDEVLHDPRIVEDPEALKAELVAVYQALKSHRKQAVHLIDEIRAKQQALKGRLEDMEAMGIIEYPEEIGRPKIPENPLGTPDTG